MRRGLSRDRADEIMHHRLSIGADILELMAVNNDLPLPNVHLVVKIMQEYCISEGYMDQIKRKRTSWEPSEDWWLHHMTQIREMLRKLRKEYFEYVRTNGLQGEWKFVTKEEFDSAQVWDHHYIGTRIETHNEKTDDAKKKWPSLNLPRIAEVPLLTDNHGKN